MTPRSRPAGSTWTGAPFTVQVRRSGNLGLIERGAPRDVPAELLAIAQNMLRTGIGQSSFFFSPEGAALTCQVTMEVRREGGFEYVLMTGEPVTEIPHRLSSRELEVLTLLVAGLGNAQMATELWISERTVASHVNRVLDKIGVPTRTAAATYALDTGLIQVPLPGSVENYSKLVIGRLMGAAASEPIPVRTRPTLTPSRPSRRRELVAGAAIPSTGKGSDDGKEMLNGLQLAIEEINGAGGVRGRTVRPLVVDVDVTSSTSVRQAMESLLNGGADVLMSGYLAAQDVAHETAGDSGVPYLHAATSGAMERAVAGDLNRFGHVFQICASDTSYASEFVSYVISLHERELWSSPTNRLVVLRKGWSHVDFGVEEAASLARSKGWTLDVVTVSGPENSDAWMQAVFAALREPATAVMIGSYFVDDLAQAVMALRLMNAPTLAYGIYAASVPAFRQQLGESAEGVLWATMTGTYSDRLGVAFAHRYAHRFGSIPGRSHAGISYDRMHRVALAWRMSDDLADAEEVATHLRSFPYRGVNGTYNFDTPGQAAQGFQGGITDPSLAQPQLIFQIQGGQHVIVQGGPFRTGRFRVPEHLRTSLHQ